MARKRPQSRPLTINLEVFFQIALVLLVLVAGVFGVQAVRSFLKGEGLFLIKDVVVDERLGSLEVKEAETLKGKNIFEADLSRVENLVRQRYPRIGGLQLVRRLPDAILVQGVPREALSRVATPAGTMVLCTDGVLVSPAVFEETGDLPVVKGLSIEGRSVPSRDVIAVQGILEEFVHYAELKDLKVLEIDMHDPEKIVCSIGSGKTMIDVYLDESRARAQVRVLAGMMGRAGLIMGEIKYIDLRLGDPLVARKMKR
ncbi:MAG: hypothetical protein GX606_00985 [Elusimicrobia bacterium]|nr:hypothetical protein [Elusimicrobiota bacterium]